MNDLGVSNKARRICREVFRIKDVVIHRWMLKENNIADLKFEHLTCSLHIYLMLFKQVLSILVDTYLFVAVATDTDRTRGGGSVRTLICAHEVEFDNSIPV